MNYYLAEIFLSARNRNNDNGGWMQILVFVMIAVVYGISYIIKAAKAEKPEEQQQKGKPQATRRPMQRLNQKRPVPVSRIIKAQPRRPIQAEYGEISRPKPVIEKMTSKLPETLEEITIQPEMIRKPLQRPKRLSVTDLDTSKPIEIIGDTPLIKFADSEMLRKAILHYEILGKPVSLRGPGEHTAG
ncbi:MAG: hypothetical protein ACYS9Y_01430 [Planctomycetota bacterium]|jgi:hypothetical protein